MNVDISTQPGDVDVSGSRVRVMIWAVEPPDDAGVVERAYHQIGSDLVGTPGLLGHALLRSWADCSRFLVVSEWAGIAEFTAWERSPGHRPTTSPLRPYHDREKPHAIYIESAAYGAGGPRLR